MSKTRKIGGFSLVEMMLMLLIVSLMIASGVTVISKKHVKVPKIAMHGAYLCYYKNGALHEEKYVGANLRRKILDRNVTSCVFNPPERMSYMHIQAIGGGGGGGDSGYRGGELKRYFSQTERMSPFGITDNLLKLKGIGADELRDYGGTMYAYANASGALGDAGAGGDIYYIKRDCGTSGDCLVHRDWKYTGASEKKCKCTSKSLTYQKTVCKYDYDCSYYTYPDCVGYYCDRCRSYRTKFCSGYGCAGCNRYEWSFCTGYSCTTCNRYRADACSGSSCDSCNNWSSYDEDGNYHYWHYRCVSGYNYTYCTDGSKKTSYCEDGYDYTSYCEDGYNVVYNPKTCTSSCTNIYNEPQTASCSKSRYNNLQVDTTDRYAQNYGKNPPIRIETSAPTASGDNMKVREVVRDKSTEYSLCNYGNTTKFSGVSDGIFGSFSGADGVGVTCSTFALAQAFGEDMYRIGEGRTTVVRTQTVSSASEYNEPLKYDNSEKDATAYGKTCRNTYNGDCPNLSTKTNAGNYTNPMLGTVYKNQKSLATDCSYSPQNYYTTNSYGCSGKSTYACSTSSPSKSVYTSCSCEQDNSSGSECMYDYGDNIIDEKRCMYYPVKISGGTAGVGTSCRTYTVGAGTNITYEGYSGVVPGIRGSDKNCTNAGYQSIYTKAQWKNQYGEPGCFAETGTASTGSAYVSLGGNSCIANKKAPTEGHGARKCKARSVEEDGSYIQVGENAPVNTASKCGQNYDYRSGGASRERNGTLQLNGASSGGSFCGSNHVGYCLNNIENGKYTYRYTWNTNYLQYGEGGSAGEYAAKIVRSIKDTSIQVVPGRGGLSGSNIGGASASLGQGSNGADGENSTVGNLLTAKGGKGGLGGKVTPTEQLPIWYKGGSFSKTKYGTAGKVASISNFKSNIMGLVLPVDNTVLGRWLAASGRGGNGGGSQNNCWASEWERWFEGRQLSHATEGYLDAADLESRGCRKPGYWRALGAGDGQNGAVLIKW